MHRTASHIRNFELRSLELGRQLGEQELRRRLWHFLPGIIAICLAMVPHRPTVRLWVMLLVIACGIYAPALIAIYYQRTYRRCRSENPAPSILGYVLPLSILCVLCRSHIEIPLTVAAIIAFGDGSATLIGLLIHGAKVPWSRKKSWAGMGAFAVCGSLLASCVYWIAGQPAVNFPQAFICVTPVVLICSLLETLPLKLNDNITVGCSSAVLLMTIQLLLYGAV